MLEDERCSAEGELFGLQLLRKGERKRRELQGKCKKCNESGGVEEGGGEGGRGGGSGGQVAKKKNIGEAGSGVPEDVSGDSVGEGVI